MIEDPVKNEQAQLSLFVTEQGDYEEAKRLADELSLPLQSGSKEQMEPGLKLCLDENGLSLVDGNLSMRGDFSQMGNRLRTGNLQKEMLIKAVRIKGMEAPWVLDATAGMGEDSILLAAAGFRVTMFEYDPIIAALLADALRRAKEDPDFTEIVGRMTLFSTDSIQAMNAMEESPDVILLDPMFPARNKSALIKKKFQLLQQLERPCSDEQDLLSAAIKAHPRKIVIKRPVKGPYLADRKPDYSYSGKAIRYDCIALPPK